METLNRDKDKVQSKVIGLLNFLSPCSLRKFNPKQPTTTSEKTGWDGDVNGKGVRGAEMNQRSKGKGAKRINGRTRSVERNVNAAEGGVLGSIPRS